MTAALARTDVPATPSPRPVRLRPAPSREPPFDDELPAASRLAPRWAARLPFEEPRRALRPLAAAAEGALPDPGRWTRRLLIGLTETAAGRRPMAQLAAMLTPSVSTSLGQDLDVRARNGRRHWLASARVRSVRATRPADEVAELSATLQCGPRVRAAALRLEVRHGCWRCTRLQLG
jgi:hypothetical protein